MSEKIYKVIKKFSDKFSKFKNAEEKSRNETMPQNKKIQRLITENEERFVHNIIATYKLYKSPFDVLGKNSSRAVEIDRDQQNLVKIYELYKQIFFVSKEKSDEDTFVVNIDFQTPLATKYNYTEGLQFIYLYAWLIYEKNMNDFVPYFEKNEHNFFKLKFMPLEEYEFNIQEKQILEVIKREFYP